MTPKEPQPHPPYERLLKRSLMRALSWVMFAWVAGLLVVVWWFSSGHQKTLGEAMVIGVASGLIAALSFAPALIQRASWSSSNPVGAAQGAGHSEAAAASSVWQRLMVCLFAGMCIRLLGTVALFLTCRYYMATPTEMIAGMTIGWYVLLTSVEVAALARELPKSAKAPNLAETSLG